MNRVHVFQVHLMSIMSCFGRHWIFPRLNLRFVAYKNDPSMNIIITFSCSMTNIKVELVLYLRQMIFNHHRVSSEVNRLTL